MHYYSFHVSDYIHDTSHLSPMEDLAFRRLLDLYYTSEKPIPNRTHEVARRIRLPKNEHAVSTVLEEFFMFDMNTNSWTHKRCDETIAAYQAKAQRNREVGRLGGRPKANPDGNQEITQTVTKRNPNHKPITNNHKPIDKGTVVPLPDGFPIDTWLAFVDMRKKLKKPMTDHAMELMIKKLNKMKDAGQDIKEVLEQSITKSWSDVYELKQQQTFTKSFDVAHQTTPTPANYDAALRKIEEDSKKAAPMPDSVRELVAKLKVKHD